MNILKSSLICHWVCSWASSFQYYKFR